MDSGRIIVGVIGLSASFFLCFQTMKKWECRKMKREKVKMISEAMEKAEERVTRCEERHDRILNQICGYYLSNSDLEEALAAARAALHDARKFAAALRDLQIKVLNS
ncbi:hypothetical protein U1Q18_004243 [Sarracenia purpurea var. burkii]